MTSSLAKPHLSSELDSLVARAAYYGRSTLADSTKKAYRVEFEHFDRWCKDQGLESMPPEVVTVAVYLAALADGNVEHRWFDRWGEPRSSKKPHKYSGVQRQYMSIVHEVRAAGHEWPNAIPAITKVMHGIRYRKGDTKRRMKPLEIADLRLCLAKMRERRYEDLTIIRDRAMLALGFFSAMRRGELVALRVEDLEFTKDGLVLHVRRSKTDQFAEGDTIGIKPQADTNVCAIALLQRYLEVSELKAGPLFRRIDARSDCMGDKPLTSQVVAMKVKEYAEKAGLDPERFAGHSLRAGFVTTAAARGVTLHNIMRQTRHKDQRTAMTYIRPASVFRNNATEGLGDEEPKK